MQTMIHDTTIVSADDAGTIYEDAAMVIESRIRAIGPAAELVPQYRRRNASTGGAKQSYPDSPIYTPTWVSPWLGAFLKTIRKRIRRLFPSIPLDHDGRP